MSDDVSRTFASILSMQYNGRKKGVFDMLFFRKNVRYVTMNAAEARLAKYALLWFRNRLIAEGKPTEDVNELLIKLMK